MSEHLPECPHANSRTATFYGGYCVCPLLRACEQRVKRVERPLSHLKGATYGREQGWNEALDAARERIMRLPYEIDEEILIDRDDVLGWLDALREESK